MIHSFRVQNVVRGSMSRGWVISEHTDHFMCAIMKAFLVVVLICFPQLAVSNKKSEIISAIDGQHHSIFISFPQMSPPLQPLARSQDL